MSAAIGTGAVADVTDSQIDASTLEPGNAVALNLIGSQASSVLIGENQSSGNAQSMIVQNGSAATIDIASAVSSAGFIVADSAGGTMTPNIVSDGAKQSGLFLNRGLFIDTGEAVSISGDTNSATRFANNSLIFIDASTASLPLDATMSGLTHRPAAHFRSVR